MINDDASPDRQLEETGDEIVVEKTFDIDGPPGHAWEKLAQLTAANDPGPATWWLPGFECHATQVAATPGHRLEVIKAEQPCKDTTIVFTFEHNGTGTRIQVTQSGFDPAFVEMAGEDFWAHGAFLLNEVERFFLGSATAETS